ncbi:MAG: response regulator [Bacteroidota bacterium]
MKKINCILLIDDNIDDNEYHEIIIQQAGVCNLVRTAKNGIEGLQYIQNAAKPGMEQEYPKANLIFLDINMPKMNGFEFLEAYHKLDNSLKAEIVICMLTTSLNPDDHKAAMDINEINEFQRKPLTVEMLNEIMEKYFKEE